MTTRPRRRSLPEDLRDIFKRIRYLEGLKVVAAADSSSTGTGIEDIILATSPVGLWKLNEPSGTTAFDSSGNGNHMVVPVGYTAPEWGQAEGPPGTQTAAFSKEAGATPADRVAVDLSAGQTDDFSAGIWANLDDLSSHELIGQGSSLHGSDGGWMLWFQSSTDKFALCIGSATEEFVFANNPADAATWYLFGVTREAGTWTIYQDGLAQTATSTTSPTGGQVNTWIGACPHNTGGGTGHGLAGKASWGFITDQPLSGADWLAIQEAGQTGGTLAEGLVWTSDGLGGASWEAPTVEVEY